MITDEKKYFSWLQKDLSEFSQNKDIQIFLYGSSIKQDQFVDIDVGIQGDISETEISKLKEYFTESTFPFIVDIINFNKVADAFKDNVFNNKVLWIKH